MSFEMRLKMCPAFSTLDLVIYINYNGDKTKELPFCFVAFSWRGVKRIDMKARLAQKLIIVALIAVVILFALISWALRQGTFSPEERVICSSFSDDGIYQVEIVAYGEPIFFGAQSIGIKVDEYGDIIYTKVGNDGKYLKESNFDISWEDHVATVIVLGEEQKPATYRIAFKGQGNYIVEREAERDAFSDLSKHASN